MGTNNPEWRKQQAQRLGLTDKEFDVYFERIRRVIIQKNPTDSDIVTALDIALAIEEAAVEE